MKQTAHQKINYTTINHNAREKLGLSWIEYGLVDLIHNLSTSPKSIDRWCYASKEYLALTLGVSRQYVHKIINKALQLKLIEKHKDTMYLRSTQLWYDMVYIRDSKQSLHPVNKVYTDSKQSLHPLRGYDSKQSLHNKDIYKDNYKPSKEELKKIDERIKDIRRKYRMPEKGTSSNTMNSPSQI